MDTLTRDTAKSYVWNQIAVTLDGLTITLGSIIVGQLLGDETLGHFGLAISVVGMVTLAAGLGLKEGVTVLVQRRDNDPSGVGALLRGSLRLRLVTAVIAVAVTAAYFAQVRSFNVYAIAAISAYVALVLISGLLSSFNIALFQTRTVAIGKAASGAVTLALVITGGLMHSLPVVLAGFAFGTLVGAFVFFAPLTGFFSGPSPACPMRELLDLSLAMWLIGFSNYVLGAQAVPLILKLAGASAAQIGVFFAAFTVAGVANRAFMGGFANVSLAAFSRAAAEGQQSFASMHSLYIRVTAMMGVPILFAAAVFSPLLAKIPVKGAHPNVAISIVVLCAAFAMNRLFGGGAHSNALYAAGLHRAGLLLRAVFAALSFAAAYFAAPFGVVAVCAAVGASGVAVVVAEYAYLRHRCGLVMPWSPLVRIALACGAVALASTVIDSQGGVFATAFAVVVFVVGSFSAIAVAHPLQKGEVALIGVSGRLARSMLLFEGSSDNGL